MARGFTLNLRGETPTFSANDYVVSLSGLSRVFGRPPDMDEIRAFVRRRQALLVLPGIYLGGWICGNRYYLDLSIIVPNKTAAMVLARAQQQQSIFHLDSGRSIDVGPEHGTELEDSTAD